MGVLGVGAGLLGLAGCEVSNLYAADCTTSPPVPHQEHGAISATVDVPPEVHPGDTFTLTVIGIGVEAGPSTSPPPARMAAISISGGATPSSASFGSIATPAAWPATVEVTVTGAAGESIEISVTGASQIYGTPPNWYMLSCTPADTHLVTIPIVD